MSEIAPKKRTGRSVLAIVAGLLTVVALDLSIDAVMHLVAAFPPAGRSMTDKQCLLAISYRLVDGVIGGYVAARLAPNRALHHAVILGCIGVLLSLAGALATWNMKLGPRWYALSLIVIALPCASAGGAIRRSQLSSRST
jgi:hypothetical protein